MNGYTEHILDLTPGIEYDYAPVAARVIDGVRLVDCFRRGRYRIVCTAREGRTMQEMVVYQGVGDSDGKHFLCSLSDFAVRFIPPAAAETEGVENVTPEPSAPVESHPVPVATNDHQAWYRRQAQEMADRYGEPVLIVPAGAKSSVMETPSPCAFLTLLSQADKSHVSLAERIEPTGHK